MTLPLLTLKLSCRYSVSCRLGYQLGKAVYVEHNWFGGVQKVLCKSIKLAKEKCPQLLCWWLDEKQQNFAPFYVVFELTTLMF